LSEYDAYVFNRMVRVYLKITLGFDRKINQSMTSDLLEHVIKKRQPGAETGRSRAVKIQTD